MRNESAKISKSIYVTDGLRMGPLADLSPSSVCSWIRLLTWNWYFLFPFMLPNKDDHLFIYLLGANHKDDHES